MRRHTDNTTFVRLYIGFYVICLGIALAEQRSAWNLRRAVESLEVSHIFGAFPIRPSLDTTGPALKSHRMERTLLFESLFRTESFEVSIDPESGRILGISRGWEYRDLRSEVIKVCSIIALCGWFPLLLEAISRVRARRRRS